MIAAAANLGWLAWNAGARQKFSQQLRSPEETQQAILTRLLSQHAATAFGQAHGFASIRSAADYRRQVPLADYEILEPWIQRIKRGEENILTAERVTHFVPTSGSSGARKLIPFTTSLQREFNAAINPWVADIFSDNHAAFFGPAYWSISPALPNRETEASAIPVGFDDDTDYLGGASHRLINAAMAVPSSLRHVTNPDHFFLLTLYCLLRCRDLRLISVWHPSFLALLLDRLPSAWPQLVEIIQNGRLPANWDLPAGVERDLRLTPQPNHARQLSTLAPHDYSRLWPQLQVISCWADANAAAGAADLEKRLPGVTVQPKGLLATEAFVTLPFYGRHPLAVGSHYFEFLDERGDFMPLAALTEGQTCEIVVTTGGGLWRYRLGDLMVVNGRIGRTPSLRFVGRTGRISDLRGEKLSDAFVGRVLPTLWAGDRAPNFALLAPNDDPAAPGYTLFVSENTFPSLAERLDAALSANPHYAWCRQIGQLHPARVFVVSEEAGAVYLRRMTSLGQKPGNVKLPSLALTSGWAAHFSGRNAD